PQDVVARRNVEQPTKVTLQLADREVGEAGEVSHGNGAAEVRDDVLHDGRQPPVLVGRLAGTVDGPEDAGDAVHGPVVVE
ncbi:MAG: hypothetical protein ACK56I_29655, partial [bacterium]